MIDDDDEIMTAAMFAVHNDMRQGGKLQFVERSYILPTEVVAQIHRILEPYEMPGSARPIWVEA